MDLANPGFHARSQGFHPCVEKENVRSVVESLIAIILPYLRTCIR